MCATFNQPPPDQNPFDRLLRDNVLECSPSPSLELPDLGHSTRFIHYGGGARRLREREDAPGLARNTPHRLSCCCGSATSVGICQAPARLGNAKRLRLSPLRRTQCALCDRSPGHAIHNDRRILHSRRQLSTHGAHGGRAPLEYAAHMGEGLWIGLAVGLLYVSLEITSDQAIKMWVYNAFGLGPEDSQPARYYTWADGRVIAISRDDLTRNAAPFRSCSGRH